MNTTNKAYLKIAVTVALGLISILAISPMIFANNPVPLIPDWVKPTAQSWIDDVTDEHEFIIAIESLIEADIIVLSDLEYSADYWEEKYNTSLVDFQTMEDNYVAATQSTAAQHQVLYAECEDEIVVLNQKYDDKMEEWGDLWTADQETIGALEQQVKDLEKEVSDLQVISAT